MRQAFLILLLCLVSVVWTDLVSACEICGCAISRPNRQTNDQPFFVEYMFEQQNWHKRDPQYAYDLGQEGHDTHDKTTEDFHHYLLGAHLGDRLLLTGEMSYIVRRALIVDDLDHLGDHMRSQGWGDLQVTGQYDVLKDRDRSVGLLAGVKFPTGSTEEKSDTGDLFEPEMQPGTGSYDYLWGGAFRQNWRQWMLSVNSAYTLKTTGTADFRFGNSFLTVMDIDYGIGLADGATLRPGFQLQYLHEAHQVDQDVKVGDSGGDTIFAGPILRLDVGKHVSVFSSFQSPVYQDQGGVHQTLDYVWTLGGKLGW